MNTRSRPVWPAMLRPLLRQIERVGIDRLVFWIAVVLYTISIAWGQP